MGTDAVSAHLDRAWELLAQGDLKGARASARRVLQLEGDSPEAHNLLGQVDAQSGDVDAAMEHYRTAMALDDGYPDPFLNAADLLIFPLRDYDAAVELCDEVLEFVDTPEEIVDAMLLKFDALLARGDDEGARRLLDGLPEGPYEQPMHAYLVGRAYFETGDVERAEAHIQEAARAEPDNPDPQYYLALVREKRGDWRGAAEAFLRCRNLDRDLPAPPWSLPAEQFQRSVGRALEALEPAHARHIEGALVVVEAQPGVEVVADGIDPRLGVLVEGIGDAERPPRVFVYQRNIERACGGVEELDDELLHQLSDEIEHLTTHAVTPRPPPVARRTDSPAEAAGDDERAARKPRKPRN